MTPRPDNDWLTLFEGVTHLWWSNGSNDQEIDVGAMKAFLMSGKPQGVHRHPMNELCGRGGGCYVLRRPEGGNDAVHP